MTDVRIGRVGGMPDRPLAVAEWLSLAAAPAFGAMAVWTSFLDTGQIAALCSTAHVSPIGGMGTMYVLMSAVHTTPWLRLLSRA